MIGELIERKPKKGCKLEEKCRLNQRLFEGQIENRNYRGREERTTRSDKLTSKGEEK